MTLTTIITATVVACPVLAAVRHIIADLIDWLSSEDVEWEGF